MIHATNPLPIETGVTADEVGKKLSLDVSSAHRRLKTAIDRGFAVNLETRHRQPGRYRPTDKAADVIEMLPSAEGLIHAWEAESGGE